MDRARVLEAAALHDALPPEKFDLHQWCGTACCVAGNIARAHDPDYCPSTFTAQYLELDEDVASELFVPALSGEAYASARPWHAAAVLRILAEEGRARWDRVFPDDERVLSGEYAGEHGA